MKKKVLGLLLALCLVVGLLPVAAFAAEAPEMSVHYKLSGHKDGTVESITLNKGDAAVYLQATGTDATYTTHKYLAQATTEPTDNYVKLDYTGDVPVVTLKNIEIINVMGLSFGKKTVVTDETALDTLSNCPYKVVLEGTNTIDSCGEIRYGSKHAYGQMPTLAFVTTGDVTIAGPGTLNIKANNGSDDYVPNKQTTMGAIMSYGNLTLDNANITIQLDEVTQRSEGIYVRGGNMVIKGGKLDIDGIDDPTTAGDYGQFRGSSMYSGIRVNKDGEVGGDLTVQDNANVKVVGSCHKDQIFHVDGKITFKDSTIEAGLAGYFTDSMDPYQVFSKLPTLEYSKYAAVTASRYTYKQNKGTNTYTAPTTGLIEIDASTAASRVKYYKVVPSDTPVASGTTGGTTTGGTTGGTTTGGTTGGITTGGTTTGGTTTGGTTTGGTTGGTTTGGTTGGTTNGNPNDGDMNVALTAVVALSSALSMAGAAIIRKRS